MLNQKRLSKVKDMPKSKVLVKDVEIKKIKIRKINMQQLKTKPATVSIMD